MPPIEAPTAIPAIAPVLSPFEVPGDGSLVGVTSRVAVRSAMRGLRVMRVDMSGASKPVRGGAVMVAPPVGLPPTTVRMSVGRV